MHRRLAVHLAHWPKYPDVDSELLQRGNRFNDQRKIWVGVCAQVAQLDQAVTAGIVNCVAYQVGFQILFGALLAASTDVIWQKHLALAQQDACDLIVRFGFLEPAGNFVAHYVMSGK